MSGPLKISAPRRRNLLEGVAWLLKAKVLVDRAAARTSSGGILIPTTAIKRELDELMSQLLETVRAAMPPPKKKR